MASFSIEEFAGNGVLREFIPKLLEQGWDDVPTLKIMNAEDMDAINMTQQQKYALEIRTYLHDRSLTQYGDKLESSGKSLPELLAMKATDLSTQFGLKRGHIARFTDRAGPSADPSLKLNAKSFSKLNSRNLQSSMARDTSLKIGEGYNFKGIVSAGPAESRICGCVKAPEVVGQVAPYKAIENISVQKLAPEYKIGMERLVKSKAPPMKASELWLDRPAVLLCIRRPGCIMCRAEAHSLYTKKPIFDALGIQLYAVLHENLESEVKDFWPGYWGGPILLDPKLEFFRALGGGELLKDKFLSGFVFNPRALANYRRAKTMGIKQNFKGEGEIKGGLFIVGTGRSGIAYQFIERNFGDWAPVPEVIEICTQLQKQHQDQGDSANSAKGKSYHGRSYQE